MPKTHHVTANITAYDLILLRQEVRERHVNSSPDGFVDRYGDLIEELIDLYEENAGFADEALLQQQLDEANDEIEDLKDELSSLENRNDSLCQENDGLERENRRLSRKIDRLIALLGKDEDDSEEKP